MSSIPAILDTREWVDNDPVGRTWRTFTTHQHVIDIPNDGGEEWTTGRLTIGLGGIEYLDGEIHKWVRIGDETIPLAGLRDVIAALTNLAHQ
ncbi:hypothetical protein C1S82_20375 [Mycolicibacterium cosmeticum]|uniref:Uncharacterized protein n=1 Tax=Mycolicibacterium cosmeticum TaxID=258533 RepID=W9BI52_MYCCO|nr:hypothetical protein [Mycolicibacterium cosmeticum]TLH71241.1 hypothetical protein C1S82_20375 [Mycolicibacterium cosmeticum]CDO06400.1 hypothetical protein BN977_01188 [Mycolicibacterium cosmeticum]